MENLKESVISNVGAFIAVLIIFGLAWKHLDEQRIEIFKEKEEAIKLKAEVDVREQYLAKKEKDFSELNTKLMTDASLRESKLVKNQAELDKREKADNIDTELRGLASKYLDESSAVNTSRTCGDDEEHNSTVRKAMANLALIESMAKQYHKPEFISFAENQTRGIHVWDAKCKP